MLSVKNKRQGVYILLRVKPTWPVVLSDSSSQRRYITTGEYYETRSFPKQITESVIPLGLENIMIHIADEGYSDETKHICR